MLLPLITFTGEIPASPGHLLPDNAAQYALNCDFMHGELRGLRDNALVDTMSTYGGQVILSVWTEDGQNFFGWPYDSDVVKGLVTDDIHHRIYYTAEPPDGPIIKCARTSRNVNGSQVNVIGSSIVGGQYKPPEASSPPSASNPSGNNQGPDSWILGLPPPQVRALLPEDLPLVVLTDRESWPGAPNLKLRVTYFVENPAGEIVYQQDVSNSETIFGYPQVCYSVADANRGNKVQDMMWALLNVSATAIPNVTRVAPYKFYWCEPPAMGTVVLSRVVRVTNPSESTGAILIAYDGGTTIPPDPVGSGDGSGSGSGGDGGDA